MDRRRRQHAELAGTLAAQHFGRRATKEDTEKAFAVPEGATLIEDCRQQGVDTLAQEGTWDESRQTATTTIAGLPPGARPAAVFCANDLIALGMLQAMTHSRIRVPEDLAILRYDDIEFAAAARSPLCASRAGNSAALPPDCSSRRPPRTTGTQHRHVIFQPELVVRQSTRADDPAVQS